MPADWCQNQWRNRSWSVHTFDNNEKLYDQACCKAGIQGEQNQQSCWRRNDHVLDPRSGCHDHEIHGHQKKNHDYEIQQSHDLKFQTTEQRDLQMAETNLQMAETNFQMGVDSQDASHGLTNAHKSHRGLRDPLELLLK